MSTEPEVSIVIPTHNRAASLAGTLRALEVQVDAPRFEVIVVDDASTDGTAELLQRRRADSSLALTAVRQDVNQGPAAARNRGWRAARGSIVCFTDDDCRPDGQWISALVSGLEGHDIAQGRTIPDPEQRDRWGPFSHTVEVITEAGFYETCNMAYRRPWLERTGGFDEGFRYPYGEDTDLAWRAKELGATTAFVPSALVVHDISDSDFVRYLRLLRRRSALVHLLRLHSEARSLFPGRWYHKPTHPPALAVVGSLMLAGTRPRSWWRWAAVAASGTLYSRACLRTWRGPERGREWGVVVPMALVADLTEIAILARASIHERTFFL